ncbi:hypothetical protein RND81_10G138600 [Saponaria officinalis]|uniref:DUF674 domain-containing protein n=1 Tax=Saponaria officinalis TaxID=3572 RepID=A0AAW1I244_SAPOF
MGEQEKKMSLKLLVDTTSNKVLFAEAGKDFVDFLFHIMSLPVGTIVKLIGLKGMVGSVADLYKSISSLDNAYLQENIAKDAVLNPKSNVSVPLLLLNESPKPVITTLYRCSGSHYSSCSAHNVTDDPNRTCPSCRGRMNTSVTYLRAVEANSSSTANGYVKGVMTYMVMDNLEVKPSSTISAITLLNKSHVKDIGSLVEKEVQIGLNEGVEILKASLETKAVLSTVFLRGK